MIIVKIQGGLGNQMFQYAAGKNLAIKNNDLLKLDISDYDNKNNQRCYSLNNFLIEENIATKEEIKQYNTIGLKKFIDRFKPRIKRRCIMYNKYTFDEDILKIKKHDFYLNGYWQSEKYSFEIKDIIRHEFRLKVPIEKKDFNLPENIGDNTVSLHVRRGDYLDSKFSRIFGILPVEYYHKAINTVTSKINNANLIVFSDDIPWVKKNLSLPRPTIFLNNGEKNEDYKELMLMSYCKHNIIANSSFSWWGAWLNPNFNKIIVAPKKWFAIEEYNHSELIPKEWVKL